MKQSCLTKMIAVFLFFCINGIQAQTTQAQLNQMELMKQFIGTWECEVVKDTTFFNLVVNPFGTALECKYELITNGKTVKHEKWLWGYDKINDKIIEAVISDTYPNITLNAYSFISKNTIEKVSYKSISDFNQSSWKMKFEFINPDLISMSYTTKNAAPATWKATRVK
jgi:hypothetical protein